MRLLLTALALFVLSSVPVFSQDSSAFLRLASALTRSSNFAPSIGIQASAAHASGWSVNPASDDVRPHQNAVGTATFLGAFSQSGAFFTAPSITTTLPVQPWGTLSLAFARTDTPDGSNADKLQTNLQSNEYFIALSHAFSDIASMGVETRFTSAVLSVESASGAQTPFPNRINTDIDDFTLKIGMRLQISEVLAVGAINTVAFIDTTSHIQNIFAVPTAPPIPPNSTLAIVDESILLAGIRVGLGYTAFADVHFYSDAEFQNLTAETSGGFRIGRFYSGLEILLADHWKAYSGVAIDTLSETALSTALSYRASDNLIAELAVQHNAFPEINPEFGEFQFVSISLTSLF